MKLREEFEVAEPVASVWTFFERPEAVAQCVPGVEQLTVLTPDDIEVRLTQSVGPMTATFAAKVAIVERVTEKLIGFTATGKSVRGAMGNVRASVTVTLSRSGSAPSSPSTATSPWPVRSAAWVRRSWPSRPAR